MSADLPGKDPSGGHGHVVFPRRAPLWPVITAFVVILGAAFGFGGWAWATEARLTALEAVLPRVAVYMCMDCIERKGQDACRFICGLEEQP